MEQLEQLKHRQVIRCNRCKRSSERDCEFVEYQNPRRVTYAYVARCKCGCKILKMVGSSKWEGGPTPHKITDQNYRDRKKQKRLYDAIENLPKLKAYHIPE